MAGEAPMIAIVWQFEIRPGRETEFEAFYGADGEWTAASRHSRSYLGSSFLRDQSRSSRYLVIEYWSEMLVYERHKAYHSDQTKQLLVRRDELVSSVEPMGVFTALDVPDRAGPTWSRRT
jgi:quinol monooxygenase YgiN